MKKSDLKTITILNGWNEEEKINARFLGRGSFATCYESNGVVYSFIKAGATIEKTDYSKEAISEFASGNNIPEFEKMGTFDNGVMLFKSPLYQPLTPANKKAWQQFRELQSAWYEVFKGTRESDYDYNWKIINLVRGHIDESIIFSIESIVNACANYGDFYRLEFPLKNLKVDETGKLILLDVIFNQKALR